MTLITTPGRARQKTLSLAKKYGIEVKAVCLTREEVIEALGYNPFGPRQDHKCTESDTALARVYCDSKVIWLDLPVSLNTIAHELTHLVTTTNHFKASFRRKLTCIQRGTSLAKSKGRYFEVTETIIRKWKVFELTAYQAKARRRTGTLLNEKQTLKAKGL